MSPKVSYFVCCDSRRDLFYDDRRGRCYSVDMIDNSYFLLVIFRNGTASILDAFKARRLSRNVVFLGSLSPEVKSMFFRLDDSLDLEWIVFDFANRSSRAWSEIGNACKFPLQSRVFPLS